MKKLVKKTKNEKKTAAVYLYYRNEYCTNKSCRDAECIFPDIRLNVLRCDD